MMSTNNEEEMAPSDGQADSDSHRLEEADIGLAKHIINTLVDKGVKVLALDFDKTIVSIHTCGFWQKGTPRLAEYVRPCFKALISAGLEKKLFVCIVTYSRQPALIRDVLKMVLPKCETHKVLIRANSKDWLPNQAVTYGKQQHIAWIVTELFNKHHAIIRPEEILLMDDDDENVTLARDFGHLAYEVPDSVTLDAIGAFVDTLELPKETITPVATPTD